MKLVSSNRHLSLLLGVIQKHQGGSTFTTRVAVVVNGHESRGSTADFITLTTQTSDLAVVSNLVVFEDGELDVFLSVAFTFGLSVLLLLSLLLTSTTMTKNQMKSGFLLDVVVGQRATVFELLTSEDQTLLIRRDTF